MQTRRGFIASIMAASSLPALSWADAGSPAYLGAARRADGSFALFGLTAGGDDVFRIALPDRGHAAAAHPTAPEAVASIVTAPSTTGPATPARSAPAISPCTRAPSAALSSPGSSSSCCRCSSAS